MKIVKRLTPIAILLTAIVLPAAARAQAYASVQPAPLYPYVAQSGRDYQQPYAVEVAPGRYVIHRSAASGYPYVRCARNCDGASAEHHARRRFDRPPVHNDPALIDQLRHRAAKKVQRDVINTTRIVREKPIVIEHERVVEDPPRVIVRRHYVEDAPASRKHMGPVETEAALPHGAARDSKARVIRAEAEVTILGPDSMTIRLFRKRATNAHAQATKAEAGKPNAK
jgi:hypothetical protein